MIAFLNEQAKLDVSVSCEFRINKISYNVLSYIVIYEYTTVFKIFNSYTEQLYEVPWLSWLKRLPSKQEITSSNLVGTFLFNLMFQFLSAVYRLLDY